MMERLTERTYESCYDDFCDYLDCPHYPDCPSLKTNNRLAYYEDMEEQGRLVVLPCKVGTPVFIIGCKYRGGRLDRWVNTGNFRWSDLEKFGKTVFLTRELAEEALNEQKKL